MAGVCVLRSEMAVWSSAVGLSLARGVLIVPGISPFDHELIERTRKINKTLSLFVFALQEQSDIPAASQVEIANVLVSLADTIRTRASSQPASNNGGLLLGGTVAILQIEARRENSDSEPSNQSSAALGQSAPFTQSRERGDHEIN
jgi:hypothetical protein